MSQDSKVFFRIFFGIGLLLILISVVIFYNQFTYSKDAIHTEGVIVDTVLHSSHSHRTGKNGSWYPVVAFRPTPDYTLIFNSSIGSDFYEDSEGDKVNVYYSPGHPEKAEINNPWVNFFKWGFIGIMGVIFIAVGLLISMPSSKKITQETEVPSMKKITILLSLLILLPLTVTSKPLIPIMKTLFTDVTGTVPDAEEIARKAELFRQQTGIAPFIVVVPGVNEASFRQNGKAMLAHASSSLSDVKGSVLLLFTTREPRLIMITNGHVESSMDDKHLGLLVENHTLAYLHADLWYQGINNALAVLQAQILKQPTPPLTYYPHPGQQQENDPPGSTTTLGLFAWAVAFIVFTAFFNYTTRLNYALKFAVAMTIANMGYQALCLYIDNSFAITRISPLWAGLIGVCTFIAALLLTSKR